MFRDRIHLAPEPLAAVPSLPLLIGVDFGLTPAAVIAQRLADGRWLVLDELVTEECGIQRFGETLAAYMARTFPNHGLRHCQGWGDPAGNQRAQTDERTALAVLREHSRSEEHTSELQSLMRNSFAVLCFKKKND